ncbi:MAG: hypothetical protein WAS07_06320 [Micropruina sp.]
MTDINDNITAGPSKVSRRTLAAGAAWSVPVIATVSAAPAFALSGPGPSLAFLGACKLPGNSCHIDGFKKGYKFNFRVTNNDANNDIYLCAPITFTATGTGVDPLIYTPQTPCILIPAGSSSVVPIFADAASSANLVFTTTMTVTWGHECPCSDDTHGHPTVSSTFTVDGTPPNCDSCTGTT